MPGARRGGKVRSKKCWAQYVSLGMYVYVTKSVDHLNQDAISTTATDSEMTAVPIQCVSGSPIQARLRTKCEVT